MNTLKLTYLIIFVTCPLISQNGITKDISIYTRFNLQIVEDDKPTRSYIVGHLDIERNVASWYDVYIAPMDFSKQVMLKPEFNSSDRGDIKDLSLSDGHFSFSIVLEPDRLMHVSGTLDNKTKVYQVQAIGIWWSDILQRSLKMEWIPASTPVVLPYMELFD
ncbi:MAG: hypothetical protein EPO24_10670 [Bacteroidetes bacterium]|nr:MAG: hypothetical protein EPO24_10670 [Bacteroidota bacterium]